MSHASLTLAPRLESPMPKPPKPPQARSMTCTPRIGNVSSLARTWVTALAPQVRRDTMRLSQAGVSAKSPNSPTIWRMPRLMASSTASLRLLKVVDCLDGCWLWPGVWPALQCQLGSAIQHSSPKAWALTLNSNWSFEPLGRTKLKLGFATIPLSLNGETVAAPFVARTLLMVAAWVMADFLPKCAN